MNNFERRKFLDYLEKLLPQTDIKDYQFDNIVDFIISEFHINQKKFLKDENNIILTDTAKQRQNLINTLKAVIKKQKEKAKPHDTILEKQFLMVKDIYGLTDEEYEIMVFLALKEINAKFSTFYDCLEGGSLGTFCRYYLKMRCGKKERIMDTLYMKDITDYKRGESINHLSPIIIISRRISEH